MAFFPKILDKTDTTRIVWVSPDEVVIETVAGKSAFGEEIWKQPNKGAVVEVLLAYTVKRLKKKYADEIKSSPATKPAQASQPKPIKQATK
jgi:hypothetical protein